MEASATTLFCLRRSNSRLPVLTAGPRLAGGWGEMWGGQQGGSAGASGVAFV